MSNLIGSSLGPYRIISQIGVGGMATVYKAYQPNMDRYVAVKVLPHYLSQDEQFARRFQREAKAVAKLEHAHILPVYDYGESDGITYIAMRYVEAGTLKQRIAAGPLSLDEIDRVVGQVGSALDYAHRMGVIHRDVKPGNVLIDAQDDCYLTDFGLARMLEGSDQLTASGVGIGTPAYMSPEQGQGIKADHRSDIYSLGIILYELATGRVPYEAETPMAVMLKHITDPLPLPRSVNPDVPEAVERVILKALAKDPNDRYQAAGEMAQALTAAVRQAELAEAGRLAARAREDISFITRLERAWAQPRGKAMLIGIAALALVALGLLLSQLPGRVQIAGDQAQIIEPAPTTTPVAAPAGTSFAAVAPSTSEPSSTLTPSPTLPFTSALLPGTAEPFACPSARVENFGSTGGFGTGRSSYARWGAIDGEYSLSMTEADSAVWRANGLEVADAILEVDVRVEKEGSGAFGIVFGADSLDNGQDFYAFMIDAEGYYALFRHSVDEWTTLKDFSVSSFLARGGESNHLKVVRLGPLIALYANGEPIGSAIYDDTYTGRRFVGLTAWSNDTAGLEARFDNFTVCPLTEPIPMPVRLGARRTLRWPANQPVLLVWGWLTAEPELAQDFADAGDFTLEIDGKEFTDLDAYWSDARRVGSTYLLQMELPLTALPPGEHTLAYRISLREQVSDGYDDNKDGKPDTYGPGEVFSGEVILDIKE